MANKDIRILVFTVPSWNSKVGANSWATLLGNYDSDKIANIYLRDEVPDSTICSRYFNISENKVIKSVLKRKTKTGTEVTPCIEDQDSTDLNEHNERYAKMQRKRRYSMLLAREVIWKLGKWKTKELDDFLDSFKPNIILHSMDGYIHMNRIIEYALKRTGAKAIGYIWDDNFTYKQSKKLGYKMYRYFQRKSLKKLAKKTDDFFAITDMTKKEADEFFGIDCKILTKPLNKMPEVNYTEIKQPIEILYTGSLIIGRDNSLEKVSRALENVNREEELFSLNVYTQTQLSQEKRDRIENKYCHINEPISQAEALEKQRQADMLLFLEDVDGPDAQVARLSFSTKITDYLSSGKCILAVGCKETAPMQYFINNNAAMVASSVEEIETCLKAIVKDKQILKAYAEGAKNIGLKNHSPEHIQRIFDSTLESVFNKTV